MATKRSNPLRKAGWLVLFSGFGFLLLTFAFGLEETLGPFIVPVIFFCCCFTLVWLYFQIQTGEIWMTNQNGVTYKYVRAKEPIMFFIVCGMIGIPALFLAVTLGSDLFLGCEGSLINPCSSLGR